MAWHDIRISCTALGPSGRHCSPAQSLTPLLPSVMVKQSSISSEQLLVTQNSPSSPSNIRVGKYGARMCPKLPLGSAADSWPARPAPKVPAIAGATLVPAVPSHGILQTPKYEPGSVRVAPGLVINERLFVEELVIPDSTVATTEWRLDLLETRLNFLSGSELWGTLRHPDPLPVSRLPWKSGWPCYVSLCK